LTSTWSAPKASTAALRQFAQDAKSVMSVSTASARPGDGGDLLRHRVETVHDRRGQHKTRAPFCEAEAHRAAKAAVGSGHDDDATLKIDVGQVHFRHCFPP
jgi:hypothetical protein